MTTSMTDAAPRSGTDRAAIMVMLLSEDDASRLLSHLSPDELRQLSARMCSMGEIAPTEVAEAIEGFARSTPDGGIPEHGRMHAVRRLLTGAVGELPTDSLLRQLGSEDPVPPSPSSALGMMRWLDPEVIAGMLADEHPQTIAVLLLQLDTEVAAAALAKLPEDLHTPVLHRVARLGPVSAQALAILEDTVKDKIAQLNGGRAVSLGGIRQAADIINRAHRSLEKRVIPSIGKIDKPLAKALEDEMFKFEHLFALDQKMTGVLLREIESDLLIAALRGIELEQREHFFAAMSQRAADGLRDEIESRGRMKRTDIEAAQRQIVAIAKRLVASGELIMGDGDEDYA